MNLTRFIIRLRSNFIPLLYGQLTRLIYHGSNIIIGQGLRCDSIPTITVDPDSKLLIGDNVVIRKDVELRSHGKSTLAIGTNVRLDRGIRLLSSNNATVSVGDGSRIGLYSVVNGGDSITIGERCLISGFVYLQSSMHRHAKGVYMQDQGYDHAPVALGDDVWLGAHVVVLPGCTIGAGGVVGSNAVVTKDVDKDAIVAGVPARFLQTRKNV